VHSLVSFSHSGQQKPEEFEMLNLRTCANEAIQLLSLQLDKHEVIFDNQIEEEAVVPGDTQRLIQVFVNLLSNARDASPANGRITLSSAIERRFVTVSVTDEGPGISEDLQARIIEPFFTTKEPGEGTGLGLAMVYSIVEDHQGQLNIESPVDKVAERGAKFDIILPSQLATDRERGTTT
jgi:signal transduction histidine kinase